MVTPAISTWLVSPGLRAAVARQPYWIQVIEAVILADLGFYVAHRLFHGVPWLWRFHAIHHSIQELDWLASVRVHVLDHARTGFRRGADRYLSGSLLLALHTSARQRADELRAATLGNRLARVSSLAPRRSAGRLREEFRGTAIHPRQAVRDNVHAEGQTPERYGLDEPVPHTYISQMLYPFKWARRIH